jgi:AraC-like DNA-binding protein
MNGGNGTDTCGPCSFGHVEIPEWALALVECDSANTTFDTLGAALVSRPPRERKADPREEWSRRVILEEDREYMAELHRNGLNVMQIGERVGCHYTTVKYHLRQMGYGRDHTPSPETVARVLDMAPTHTRTQTAQALGLTIRRVNLIYQEHGLELVRGKSPRPAWSGKRGEAA